MEKDNVCMVFDWEYCEESDILSIKKKNKLVKGSAELGDFIVDFDVGSNVVGVEILYASEFFGSVGISEKQLLSIEKAELALIRKNNIVYVNAKILLPKNIERVIPIPAPVVA